VQRLEIEYQPLVYHRPPNLVSNSPKGNSLKLCPLFYTNCTFRLPYHFSLIHQRQCLNSQKSKYPPSLCTHIPVTNRSRISHRYASATSSGCATVPVSVLLLNSDNMPCSFFSEASGGLPSGRPVVDILSISSVCAAPTATQLTRICSRVIVRDDHSEYSSRTDSMS
jgi:hypothetical protein